MSLTRRNTKMQSKKEEERGKCYNVRDSCKVIGKMSKSKLKNCNRAVVQGSLHHETHGRLSKQRGSSSLRVSGRAMDGNSKTFHWKEKEMPKFDKEGPLAQELEPGSSPTLAAPCHESGIRKDRQCVDILDDNFSTYVLTRQRNKVVAKPRIMLQGASRHPTDLPTRYGLRARQGTGLFSNPEILPSRETSDLTDCALLSPTGTEISSSGFASNCPTDDNCTSPSVLVEGSPEFRSSRFVLSKVADLCSSESGSGARKNAGSSSSGRHQKKLCRRRAEAAESPGLLLVKELKQSKCHCKLCLNWPRDRFSCYHGTPVTCPPCTSLASESDETSRDTLPEDETTRNDNEFDGNPKFTGVRLSQGCNPGLQFLPCFCKKKCNCPEHWQEDFETNDLEVQLEGQSSPDFEEGEHGELARVTRRSQSKAVNEVVEVFSRKRRLQQTPSNGDDHPINKCFEDQVNFLSPTIPEGDKNLRMANFKSKKTAKHTARLNGQSETATKSVPCTTTVPAVDKDVCFEQTRAQSKASIQLLAVSKMVDFGRDVCRDIYEEFLKDSSCQKRVISEFNSLTSKIADVRDMLQSIHAEGPSIRSKSGSRPTEEMVSAIVDRSLADQSKGGDEFVEFSMFQPLRETDKGQSSGSDSNLAELPEEPAESSEAEELFSQGVNCRDQVDYEKAIATNTSSELQSAESSLHHGLLNQTITIEEWKQTGDLHSQGGNSVIPIRNSDVYLSGESPSDVDSLSIYSTCPVAMELDASGREESSLECGRAEPSLEHGVEKSSLEHEMEKSSLECGREESSLECGREESSLERELQKSSLECGREESSLEHGLLESSLECGREESSLERGLLESSLECGREEPSLDCGLLESSLECGREESSLECGIIFTLRFSDKVTQMRGSNGWEYSLRQRPQKTVRFCVPRVENRTDQSSCHSNAIQSLQPEIRLEKSQKRKAMKNEGRGSNGCKDRLQQRRKKTGQFGVPSVDDMVDQRPSRSNAIESLQPAMEISKSQKKGVVQDQETAVDLGCLVWGRLSRNSPVWPGVVIDGTQFGLEPTAAEKCWVFWFGDHKISKIASSQTSPFVENFLKRYQRKRGGKMYQNGVLEAIKICTDRCDVDLPEQQEGNKFLHWALSGFVGDSTPRELSSTGSIPQIVFKYLAKRIEDHGDHGKTSNQNETGDQLALVRSGAVRLEDVCMVCFDETADVDIQHPAFKGGLCMNCKDALVETLFSVGEDGIQVYCSICGDGGQVIVCCSPTCARVYCEPCIKTLVGERMLQKIHANDDWLCFMCAPYSRSTHGLLEGKRNWEENVDHLCSPVYNGHVRIYMEKPLNVMRKPLRVLSLCDRITTGMLVLDKLGFEVEEYFACEIDPASMAIGAKNYGDSLTQLGDMQDLHTDKLRSLKRIDLVLGCPPSQCFCGDAPNMEAWYAEDGEGVMEFARIYLSLTQNLPTHVFWLCESDASMVNMAREHISTFLEVSPSLMNASWFSYPDRVKYFWGNIPGRNRPNTSKVFSTWRAARTDSFTLPEMLSSRDSGPDGVTRQTVKYVDNVENLERQLGFPKGYTKVPQLSRSKRIALLEKAASVPLLTHMLSPLREFFKLKE